jgi:UDP-GlcNAc3NAcA epimerase
MKFVSIVGARPEFVQAYPVSCALREKHTEILVHTGQHYDYTMSQAFFDDLQLPVPDYNLEVGSGSHARQTAEIMVRLEEVLLKEQPDVLIIRGDTNSTMAGALVASKIHIPIAHIEAGERSYDRTMPEEVNRLVADRLANHHFCVSKSAVGRLAAEGITESVHWVGDVMLDVMLVQRSKAQAQSKILEKLGVSPKSYTLVTVHRAATTDDPQRLRNLADALNAVDGCIVFPIHPRTRKALDKLGIQWGPHIQCIDPVGYLDMIQLEENAVRIATDSGGVQREAYFLKIPCLTLRDETEWAETIAVGWNRLVGTDSEQILDAWDHFSPPEEHAPIFGDGTAGKKIATILENL